MVPAQWYNVPGAFEAIKNTPVWAYHCKDDPEMPEAETAKAVPVSYTHLDVYKRQVHPGICLHSSMASCRVAIFSS